MKKIITTLSVVIMLYSSTFGQGSTYRTGEFIRITHSDSITTQLLAAGNTVEMFGWIGNDFISAGELLTIDGTISDDAVVAGRQVIMRGQVGDMMFGAAENLLIDGEVNGDLFAAAREVRITEGALIRGHAHVAAASVILEGGRVEGMFRAAGATFRLNGTINNKAELYGNDFTFGPGYHAEYGTDITSDREIYRENIGYVPENLTITVEEPGILPFILFKIGLYVSLLITGLILIRLFQQNAVDLYRFSMERPWKNTGVGLLAFLLIPIAVVVLMFMVFTIPLSIILMLLYGLALLVSYLLVAMIIGVMSIRYFRNESSVSIFYWGLALGMIVLAVFVNLPFIGWILNILFIFFGLGSLVYYIWMMRNSRRTTKPPQGEVTND